MVRRELVSSRSEAKRLIDEKKVIVGGVPEPKPATLVSPQDAIRLVGDEKRWVSRGALKLIAALDEFPVSVTGLRALDVGASTGGFTEVLLHHGAGSVVALDVGRAQLHESLAHDDRVESLERTNFRHVTAEDIGTFPLIVGDVSFISLCTLATNLADVGSPGADYVLLVKPQFEAGRAEVGRGVVRDEAVRARSVVKVATCLGEVGLGAQGVVTSPIKGADGNVEYLLWLRKGARPAELEVAR